MHVEMINAQKVPGKCVEENSEDMVRVLMVWCVQTVTDAKDAPLKRLNVGMTETVSGDSQTWHISKLFWSFYTIDWCSGRKYFLLYLFSCSNIVKPI